VPDTIDLESFGALINGVTLVKSKAIFHPSGNKAQQPYIRLPSGWIGDADAISVEMWVSFDDDNNDDAVLFSFGDDANQIRLKTVGFKGHSNVYIATVYDPPSGFVTVYVNGNVTDKHAISGGSLLGGQGAFENYNYLGWDKKATTPGLSAQIDEVRFWMGALSFDSIQTSNFLGVDPTMVPLSQRDMMYNVQLNYYVTSQVKTNVGFFGGLSLNPMFGPETAFLIKSLDPQCGYSVTAPLNSQTSSWSMSLAAMNYSVTLVPNTVPAPRFARSSAFCDKSLAPYDFMNASSQLNKNIFTDLTLPSTDLNATFVYRSALCVDIAGAEKFLHALPKSDSDGLVCFSNDVTLLKKVQLWNLSISLYELLLD
jgi:hypothetical protein